MPWIDETRCTGCGICIDECPVNAIQLQEETAIIDMELCIRCALCHDLCTQEAVMHDSDKVDERIKTNIKKAEHNMLACARHLGNDEEAQKCLKRMIKHFTREKHIAEQTVMALESLQKD